MIVSMATWRPLLILILVFGQTTSVHAQFQWTRRYPPQLNNGAAWEGFHSVKYVAYMPVDNIKGPIASRCFNVPSGPVQKTYKGDPNAILFGYPPQSWRVSTFFTYKIAGNYQGPALRDPMETRNYGFGTPLNGSTISGLDEDNVQYDCFVWNDKATASNSNWLLDHSVPFPTQGQTRMYGTGNNPLEPSIGGISWDMRTLIDISNLDNIRAKVSYNHSCYPAHHVSVNNYPVYSYIPPRNDESFLFACLALRQGKIIGEQPVTTQAPCN